MVIIKKSFNISCVNNHLLCHFMNSHFSCEVVIEQSSAVFGTSTMVTFHIQDKGVLLSFFGKFRHLLFFFVIRNAQTPKIIVVLC